VSALPRQVGPFRVLRGLGVGGVGEVLLAVAHGAGGFEKRVALKVLREELRGDEAYERVLLDEARMAARFDHPNLVGVHDVGVSNGVYWVRMDWVDGADLGALMGGGDARAAVPEGVALAVAHGVAEALGYLHALTDEGGRSYGLVHRDVSPTNVLLGRNGAVKLGDFGLAKATRHREDTRAGVRKGKYAYMSPEQVRGAVLTAASDQFAVGIMLAEMLTGARPFDGDGPLETMERIRDVVFAEGALAGVAADVAAVVTRCLQREPGERYGETEALGAALGALRATRAASDGRAVAAWVGARAVR
jgi:eukaryotic-like serine/threonine-protein kinase